MGPPVGGGGLGLVYASSENIYSCKFRTCMDLFIVSAATAGGEDIIYSGFMQGRIHGGRVFNIRKTKTD